MAYNSAYTGSQVDAAVGAVRQKETKWDNKQDELTGTEDQLVGFNSAGEAVAVAKPDPLPAGGETGQVLTKTAEGTAWDDIPSDLPAGGTDGQILTKTADGVAWEDAPAVGVTSFKGRTGAVTPQEGDYTADMVGARPDTWTPSASDVGAVPTSRTVNGHALSNNVTLDAADVGAVPTQTGTQGQVLGFTADNTVGAMDAPSGLPSGGTPGQMLYQGESGAEWGDKPVMVVNVSGTETLTADKTAKEIYEAILKGYIVYADVAATDDVHAEFQLRQALHSEDTYTIMFSAFDGDLISWLYVTTDSSGETVLSIPQELSLRASSVSFAPGSTGFTADNVQDAIEELNDKLPAISLASATLYSGSWTLSGGKYAQTVQISGVTASARLILPDPDTPGDDKRADEEVLQAWGAGPSKIEPSAGNGTVTFYSWTQPTINIPIQVVVIT